MNAISACRSHQLYSCRPLPVRTIAFSWGLVLTSVKTGGTKLAGRITDCPKVVKRGLGACAFAGNYCNHSCCGCESWCVGYAHCFNTIGDAVQFQTLGYSPD